MASISGTNMENNRLAGFGPKWTGALIMCAVIGTLSGVATARDRGINQPGPVGGTAGVGAPGAGAVTPVSTSQERPAMSGGRRRVRPGWERLEPA